MSFGPETDARRARARPFVIAWVFMLLLAGVSVALSYAHLGLWAPVFQFGFAATQAAILFILFMRLKSGRHLRWIFAGTGFLWLAFLFGLSMTDYADRRGWPPLYDPSGPSFEMGHSRGVGAK